MSSLYFANALFSKHQQAAAGCSALCFTDSPTSPSSVSSASSAVSSSCALVSSGYNHQDVSNGRCSRGLPFPPSSSSSSLPSSSFFPSSSSLLCLSLSELNSNGEDCQPNAQPFNSAEVSTGEAYRALVAGPLCPPLQRCASGRFPDPIQLCSSASRLPESTCRSQGSPEQQQSQLNHRRLLIYPWMRSSGEEGVRRAGKWRWDEST